MELSTRSPFVTATHRPPIPAVGLPDRLHPLSRMLAHIEGRAVAHMDAQSAGLSTYAQRVRSTDLQRAVRAPHAYFTQHGLSNPPGTSARWSTDLCLILPYLIPELPWWPEGWDDTGSDSPTVQAFGPRYALGAAAVAVVWPTLHRDGVAVWLERAIAGSATSGPVDWASWFLGCYDRNEPRPPGNDRRDYMYAVGVVDAVLGLAQVSTDRLSARGIDYLEHLRRYRNTSVFLPVSLAAAEVQWAQQHPGETVPEFPPGGRFHLPPLPPLDWRNQ